MVRIMILAGMLVASAAACSPAAHALPTAPPGPAGSAPAGADASGGASAVPSGAITDPAAAWPAFAGCLRAHGLDIADPEVDANGDPHWGDDLKRLITDAISKECSPIIAAITQGGGGTGRQRPSYSFDSEVAFAGCLREHGLADWPDPNPNDETGVMAPGFDKADPAVRAALVACESVLVETTASPSPSL